MSVLAEKAALLASWQEECDALPEWKRIQVLQGQVETGAALSTTEVLDWSPLDLRRSDVTLSLQEIPLSDILQVVPAQDFSQLAPCSRPHCFEVVTATTVYYVGEDGGQDDAEDGELCPHAGEGREVGRGWERAVRHALMPVTPKASVGAGSSQVRDQSEWHRHTHTNWNLFVGVSWSRINTI